MSDPNATATMGASIKPGTTGAGAGATMAVGTMNSGACVRVPRLRDQHAMSVTQRTAHVCKTIICCYTPHTNTIRVVSLMCIYWFLQEELLVSTHASVYRIVDHIHLIIIHQPWAPI
jgi:hypothetical protein